MIARHMPLVRYVAGSMSRYGSASAVVDFDDLLGYGAEGLIKAVDTFDVTYNVKFSTWAVMHIRTTILDAMRCLDPMPRSVRVKSKEIDRVSYDLANRGGRWPADAEVAEEMGITVAKLRATMQDVHTVCVSLDRDDQAQGDDRVRSLGFALADDDPAIDPAQALDSVETFDAVNRAIDALPRRERAVIVAYYREGQRMRDIAARLGVTVSRVSQLHARAIGLLRRFVLQELEDAPDAHAA